MSIDLVMPMRDELQNNFHGNISFYLLKTDYYNSVLKFVNSCK